MIVNQTQFAIKVFQRKKKLTQAQIAEKMCMTLMSFNQKAKRDTFSDFERQQLETLGVDFSVKIQ